MKLARSRVICMFKYQVTDFKSFIRNRFNNSLFKSHIFFKFKLNISKSLT